MTRPLSGRIAQAVALLTEQYTQDGKPKGYFRCLARAAEQLREPGQTRDDDGEWIFVRSMSDPLLWHASNGYRCTCGEHYHVPRKTTCTHCQVVRIIRVIGEDLAFNHVETSQDHREWNKAAHLSAVSEP